MKILAIETSCDDTGISVLSIKESKKSPEFNVLSNIVASQIEMGKKYGGVFPAMAKREHQKNLVPTAVEALEKSGLLKKENIKLSENQIKTLEEIFIKDKELLNFSINFLENYEKPNIDLIAVTNGPGLEPCLWTGLNFAKALSYIWNIKIIPVNHIESHILVNYLNNPKISLPALALVVSGGHTQIILVKKIGSYKILGETRDDAAGECFDKCAKLLGLPYPGGPEIAKLASQCHSRESGNPESVHLPRPMLNTKDYDFSFSGLKTAVLYSDRKIKIKNLKYKREMSAEVQQAIIDVLIKKTIKAVKDYGAKSLILGGGVSANKELRKQFQAACHSRESGNPISLIFPESNLSTDNGLMVAVAGYFHRKKTVDWKKIQANGNLRIGE